MLVQQGPDRRPDWPLVTAAALFSVVPAALLRHWWVDDAAISFSYARSLVRGDGLVPFAGAERAEAYSDPLWVALLAAGQLVGWEPFVLSKVLGFALAAGCVPIAWKISAWFPVPHESKRAARLLATVLVATNAQHGIWAAAGLENALYSFLLALGTWRLLSESDGGGFPWSAVAFLGVALTRPEGMMYAALAGGVVAWSEIGRGRHVRAVLWVATVVIPFGLYQGARYAYFALPYPLAFYAKVESAPGSALRWGSKSWTYLRGWAFETGWGWLLPVVVAGITRISGWRWHVGVAWIGALALALLLPHSRPNDHVRVAVCLALGTTMPLLAIRRNENPVRALFTGFVALTFAFTVTTFGDWMSGYRRYSSLAVPLAGIYAMGVAEVLQLARSRGRNVTFVWFLAAVPVVWNVVYIVAYSFDPVGQTPFTTRGRVRSFDEIAERIHLDRPWVSIDHAMGGQTWFAPPSRTIDWFGLTDVACALERAEGISVADHLLALLPQVDFAHAEKVLTKRQSFRDQFVRVPKTVGRTRNDWIRRALLTAPGWDGPPMSVAFAGGPTLVGFRVRSPEVHAGGGLYVELGLRHALGDSADFVVHLVLSGPRTVSFDASPSYDGLLPVAAWRPDEVFVGRYAFALPTDLPEGRYTLTLGLVHIDDRGRTGPSATGANGLGPLPQVVRVQRADDVRSAAESDWRRAADYAEARACTQAEEAWRDALAHDPLERAWRHELQVRAAEPFSSCWAARADVDTTLDQRLDDIRTARRWDPRSDAARVSGSRLADATWPAAMAARVGGDASRAHTLFEAVVTADPTRSWARRYAEEAWLAMRVEGR